MRIRGSVTPDNLLQYVDNFRIEIFQIKGVDHDRAKLGQFFTPIAAAQMMVSLLNNLPDKIRVLDPGAGVGILSAAFISHILSIDGLNVSNIEIVAYELEPIFVPYLTKTMNICSQLCSLRGIEFSFEIHKTSFIDAAVSQPNHARLYDIAILNPPYRKIKASSKEWQILRNASLPSANLYTAFMALSTILLKRDGQFLSITPRSFCNGPYFLQFRRMFLSQMSIHNVHIYNSRVKTFSGVIQENIILHATKCSKHSQVIITSNNDPLDKDMTTQVVEFDELIHPNDPDMIIRLVANNIDRRIRELVHGLNCNLSDLGINVSTGRVVDFRAKDILRNPQDPGAVPLIYPAHFVKGYVKWPIDQFRKPSALDYLGSRDKLLVPNDYYVLVKRFTAKEEKQRVAAVVLDPNRLEFEHIGIENHLNYYHQNGAGLSHSFAKGLAAFLNSSLVDQYFRQFSGHTQVNAADLRNLKYPEFSSLIRLGSRIGDVFPSQKQLDIYVSEELDMTEENAILHTRAKIEDALEILKQVGVPRAQQNIRSALTLLSLLDITPHHNWSEASAPLRRISEMMSFFSEHYGITYAPNTRETVRRQTIHQFWQMGMVIPNPDEPNRPVNSPNYCYQIDNKVLALIQSFGSAVWRHNLDEYRTSAADKLQALHANKREIAMIPVTLPDGRVVKITSGGQNELIKTIVEDFCPRFTKGGEVLYLGDAGEKLDEAQISRFRELNIELDKHGKMPDVVVYLNSQNWLILIEAVTSHGPIDQKRQNELKDLFGKGSARLVFVTAFQSRRAMTKYLAEISWETEVWVADAPNHLIHFDGERFLGPYS